MPATTTLLGLVTPTQGTLSGTWGDTVNYGISDYVDIAVAGTLTLTNDGAVTLANTTGSSSGSSITSTLTGAGTVTAQFAIVRVTGTLTVAKVVTGPSYSKTYTVVNAATGGIVTFKASGQTGVSVAVGESAFVYFNGTDYVKIVGTATAGAAGGSTTQVQYNNAGVLAGITGATTNGTALTLVAPVLGTPASATLTNATGLPISTGVSGLGSGVATFLGTPSSANLAAAVTDETGSGALVFATSPTLVTPTLGVATATSLQGIIGNVTPAAGTFTQLDITAQGTLRLQDTTGGEYVALRAPASLGANYTLTFPADDGTSGQALITDGSGVLSWSTAASGDVYGPASATANGIALFNSTTGKLIKDSAASDGLIYGLTVGRGAGGVSSNTAFGASALNANSTGSSVTAIGGSALLNSTASENTAIGSFAAAVNTTGTHLVALGVNTLFYNSSGSYNVGLGNGALQNNTTASNNTAVGYQAAYTGTTATQVVAIGSGALYANTVNYGTAVGFNALNANTTGAANAAFGAYALSTNTTGAGNSAFGALGFGLSDSALQANTTGSYNSAFGLGALGKNTTASNNTAVGYQAGYSNVTGTGLALFGYQAGYSTTGSNVTAFGPNAARNTTSGGAITAIGEEALFSNTSANYGTAVGYRAAYSTTGANTTAVGALALTTNSTGLNNNAFGFKALRLSTTGSYNCAFGQEALQSNETGSNNVAMGEGALNASTTASNNTAVGHQALYTDQTGNGNTALGYQAGYYNTSFNNTFVGNSAGLNTTSSNNNFIGGGAGYLITSGAKNTVLGSYSGNQGGLDIRTASNYIVLSDGDGNPRVISSSSEFFITTMGSGAGTNALKFSTVTGAVTYDTSSARYKDNIRNSIYGLSHVMQMRSTQFEYKDTGRSDVGLIAEELDLIIPELVGKNKDGQPDSVSYDRMVSVLVKAIQEQQAIINSLKARLDAANL